MKHAENIDAAFAPPVCVLDRIYDPALDSSGWPDTVAEIGNSFHGLPLPVGTGRRKAPKRGPP
jgi:hypothetical protein